MSELAVYYYSCTGRSKVVAIKIAAELNCGLYDMESLNTVSFSHTAVIVFPVHCQGVPTPLKRLIAKIKAERYALCVTYGGINPGNALYEAARLLEGKIICGLYICAPHAYANFGGWYSPQIPPPFTEKIKKGGEITLPKRKTTAFARVLPDLRSRIISKIETSAACDKCGICTSVCPTNAMRNGQVKGKCVRCLKCVTSCPKSALKFKAGRMLKRYLKRESFKEPILYI